MSEFPSPTIGIEGQVAKFAIGYRAWEKQNKRLEKMTLRRYLNVYFTYPGVQFNLALAVFFLAIALFLHESTAMLLLIAIIALPVFSLVEYLLHRYVLHNRWLYRHRFTAALWKRVHFDHHQDATEISVVFSDPRTTLVPIVLIGVPAGYIIHGPAGSAAALFCGLVLTSVYEFCHASHHLNYQPKRRYLRRLKKRHLAHHFHNERGNFGITSHFWDVVFSTNYESTAQRQKSDTVRNLGYDADEALRFPWVMELSDNASRAES